MKKFIKSSIEFPQLEQELKDALFDYMISQGFEEDEVDEYSGVEVETTSEYTKYTIYAELSYNGMMDLLEALDPIIQKYDSDAYFDMETTGRAVAYIYSESAKKQMEFDVLHNLLPSWLYFLHRSGSIIATFVRLGKTK